MVRFRLAICCGLSLAFASPVAANDFPLDVLPLETELQPGQPFQLAIRGQWPAKYTPSAVDYAAVLSSFTVHEQTAQNVVEGEMTTYEAMLSLSVAKPGLYVIPAFRIELVHGEASVAAQSRRVFLEIPKGAVAAAELRDNKPLQRLPWDLGWLGWLAAILATAGLLAVAVWLYLQRKRQPVPIDPYGEFHGAITALRGEFDVEVPLAKEPAFRLSHVARQYVERKSDIAALEMTGRELLAALTQKTMPETQRQLWLALAERCRELEAVKYRPGGVSDRTFAAWCADLSRQVDAVETELNRPQVEPAS